jgi:hypothetical protein
MGDLGYQLPELLDSFLQTLGQRQVARRMMSRPLARAETTAISSRS